MERQPLFGESNDLGQLYHEWSKPSYSGSWPKLLNSGSPTPRYKTYRDAPSLDLPIPPQVGGLSVLEAIAHRDPSVSIRTARCRQRSCHNWSIRRRALPSGRSAKALCAQHLPRARCIRSSSISALGTSATWLPVSITMLRGSTGLSSSGPTNLRDELFRAGLIPAGLTASPACTGADRHLQPDALEVR